MTPDIFAEWQRRQGHRVVQTSSSSWVEVGMHIYQAFPYHCQIEPTSAELSVLFHKNNVLGVRYSTKWEAQNGLAGYHIVFEKPEYLLEELPKKARHDVQKGIKNSIIKPIPFTRLSEEGWLLRQDTLKRQGRGRAETKTWWKELCLSAEGLSGLEAWAAIVGGQMAAALIAYTLGDCCSILYLQSRSEFLQLGVNNALTFVFTKEVLKRPGKPWLFYGLNSLDAPASVDEFKFRMGYIVKPVRQRVVFHPWIAPFFNSASHAALRIISHFIPGIPSLSKIEGMVRFYLEGKKPLEQQTWPRALLKNKVALE